MRYLMWFTIGFGIHCGLWAYGCLQPAVLLLVIGAVVCAIAGGRRKWMRKGTLLCLGCFAAVFWCRGFDASYLNAAWALNEQTGEAAIRVTDYSWDTEYGTAADGSVILEGKVYQVRLYLDEKQSLTPGQRVEGSFHFRAAGATDYHAGEGIFLLAYQEGEVRIFEPGESHWRDFPARLRRQIQTVLTNTFPADTSPFVKALLLGDTRGLTYETDTDLKISGVRHVVAVSGLHVSILLALLSTVTFRKKCLTALVGFPALFLFAAVAGFTPSVNRACIMWALMLLALLLNREYDGPTALAFACLVMLTVNPLVITSVSFQLSVASVAGIYLFDSPIYTWMTGKIHLKKDPRWKNIAVRWLCTSASISLSAMVLTVPLCAYHFGTVSLVGVLTNLLTLWLISLVFYGCMAVCLLSLFWPGAAAFLARLISLPIRYILFTVKLLADFPLAAVYTRSPYLTAWLVFVYLLLILFTVSQNKRAGTLSCCAALGLCVALLASYTEPMLDDVRLTVLDVGQGQCLLLQSENRTYMIDCGGDSDSRTADLAAETLLSQGIAKLDGLILTHTDRDHAGAAENLLSRVDTDLLILPPIHSGLHPKTRGETVYAADDLQISFGDARITVFSACYPGNGSENSLCVLFESEKCDILITGDRDAFGERSLMHHAAIPDVDVLIAGHHGAADSTCDELLRAIRPEIVCISAGMNNRYGHPHKALLERLSAYGCQIYRTDQQGTIIIRR